jgi:sugar phosphate isomerase/epimerase
MQIRLGLKLWSTNHDLFGEARKHIEAGRADFIELYTVPGKTDPQALKGAFSGVPVTIHAPHENHGFNLHALMDEQVQRFRTEVSKAADALSSPVIVVHGGVGTDGSQFSKNLLRLKEPRIVLENMPKEALGGGICFGYSLDQIRFLYKLSGSLCIDFGHAIKAAASQNIPYRPFLAEILNQFEPRYFHLSDGDPETPIDEHRTLGEGSYDLSWIAKQIKERSNQTDVSVVFEVPKRGVGLENDLHCIERFKKLLH